MQALDTILHQAGARVGSLMIMDPFLKKLRVAAARGFNHEVMKRLHQLTLKPGQGVAGHVFETGQPYYLRDPKEDTLFVHQDVSLSSNFQFLSLPLKGKTGLVIGVLNIHFPTDNVLDSGDLDRLSRAANRLVAETVERNLPRPPLVLAATS
ncbi:MAG: GAF domain-containing protein [Elusimicrobia bacterium]|nr:GAF domain-containing protein [Elusimicrobiota bacterium]